MPAGVGQSASRVIWKSQALSFSYLARSQWGHKSFPSGALSCRFVQKRCRKNAETLVGDFNDRSDRIAWASWLWTPYREYSLFLSILWLWRTWAGEERGQITKEKKSYTQRGEKLSTLYKETIRTTIKSCPAALNSSLPHYSSSQTVFCFFLIFLLLQSIHSSSLITPPPTHDRSWFCCHCRWLVSPWFNKLNDRTHPKLEDIYDYWERTRSRYCILSSQRHSW